MKAGSKTTLVFWLGINLEPDKLITDLKSSSSVPNALLGINHWDKSLG